MKVGSYHVAAIGLSLAVTACAALGPGYVEVDDIHTDVAMPFIGTGFQAFVHTGNINYAGTYAPSQALLMVNAGTRVTRPAGSQFDFISVAAGEPIWLISANQVPGQIFLGIQADYGLTAPEQMPASNTTNWKSWDPDGPGPAGTGRYVMFNVVAVRGPGHLSIWDNGIFGEVNVRVASADGLDARDGLPQFIRSHSHHNWAFTAPGYYEVDFQARTFLGPNSGPGTEVVSPIATFHFYVGSPTATLRIFAPGGDAILAWPDPSPGFQLQSSPSLTAPDWTPVLTAPVVVGAEKQVRWGSASGSHFFRLRRP